MIISNKWFILLIGLTLLLSACGTKEDVIIDQSVGGEDGGHQLEEELINELKNELKEELREELKEEIEEELREQLAAVHQETEENTGNELEQDKGELGWEGQWELNDHPDLNGYLHIYQETNEGFYFDIHVAYTHVGEIEGAYAIKNGNIAKSIEDEYGCVMTLRRTGNFITSEEGSECYVWSGMAIDLNREFTR
ncbi:hypothetical protein [Alkalihalobacterium alkalinitrilicum]|uniref:hypothetical protein n=1 Tax=Alkalihalobacterium alkalinitrilicum TaxID=427920 RepID=UPI000994B9DD|nr:hypothetical protein [Alkalihalobacterium alkalinitrilicum]